MPSVFPGMDPFIERQEWEDFHTTFNTVLREALAPTLEPRYVVRVERRVYVEDGTAWDESQIHRRSDVAILNTGADWQPRPEATASPVGIECLVVMPDEQREHYLVIRECDSQEVVTVVETLSPANKRRGGTGRGEYLSKREQILQSRSHLVEIDLLRGGERMPLESEWPDCDYAAMVSRVNRRPRVTVFPWRLLDRLPSIPIPLKRGDPDALLDLQSAFTTVFDRARYARTLNYREALRPALTAAEQQWLSSRLPASSD